MFRIVARLSPTEVTTPSSAGDQRHVGGLDGHVRSRANRDADVGLGERGGVVDPVAHHRHQLPLVLEPADLQGLVLGQDLGQHAGDADLAGDGPPPCAGYRR
jgi:hypothetical protein